MTERKKLELQFTLRGQGLAEEINKAARDGGEDLRRAIAAVALAHVRVVPLDLSAFVGSLSPSVEQITLAVETLQRSCAAVNLAAIAGLARQSSAFHFRGFTSERRVSADVETSGVM
jgi:hypothetical protein